MEQFNIFPVTTIKQPKTGQILIAEPLLNDPNFTRSVILLCEHGDEGSVGFVLNVLSDLTLNDLVQHMQSSNILLYQGGPVQADTIHMLHRVPEAINGGMEVAKNIYWGGSYDELKELVWTDNCEDSDIRLFMGYSGWGPGQLENEISEGTWLITDATDQLLFDTAPQDIWKKAIELLGKKYAYLANMPTDPQLN
jgi:putative transcriptional regulator